MSEASPKTYPFRLSIKPAARRDCGERGRSVKRGWGDNIDAAAHGIGIIIRRHRLDHLNRGNKIGRDRVKRHAPPFGLGSAHNIAVNRYLIEIGVDAAHDDIARFALIGLDRYARQTLKRLGSIIVGQLADAVRRNDIGDDRQTPLALQSEQARCAGTYDCNLVLA